MSSPLEGSRSSSSSSDAEDSIYLGTRRELAVFFLGFLDGLAGLRRREVARFALAARVEGRKERVWGAPDGWVGVAGWAGVRGGSDESDILLLDGSNNYWVYNSS